MLAPGTRIGPYEISAFIGAGGMGQVYKARDVRLDRTVALKILPPHIADDPGFRERFEREARTISGLDHAHICTLYDVGREGTTDFIVMQFLDGETLAARLTRGPLSQDEALRRGSEIASALASAHRDGIVHRDLKPANIMLTKSGAKLLDFGIAKLARDSVGHGQTRTSPLTGQGTLLGTLQYMAPEQLEGREADARSDIWALGAVIHEMLTGRPAFTGSSPASVIGAILHSVPAPVSATQALTPPAIDRVVTRCLQKDPDERWQSAHDIADELKWIGGHTPGHGVTSIGVPPARRRAGWVKGAVAAGMVLLLLASTGFAAWKWLRPPVAGPAYRLSLALTDGTDFQGGIALSPDGKWLAFVAAQEGQAQLLWIRALDSFDARPIPGSEGAQLPFWSPDSRHVAFFAGEKLRRVAIAGGAPQILTDTAGARGGTWNRDNVIVFAAGFTTGLSRISADGGDARPLTTLKPSENSHRWPHFLPDGRHYLYLVRGGQAGKREGGVYIGSLDNNDASRLLAVDSSVVYAPQGYLLYVQAGMLMAHPFSSSELKFTGEPYVVSDKVQHVGDSGPSALGVFTVSGDGLLVYSSDENVQNELAWFDRTGKRLSTQGGHADYSEMWLSPKQTEAVVCRNGDLWVVDFTRDAWSRLSFEDGSEVSPVWSPDGKLIVYSLARDGSLAIRSALSGGVPQLLLKIPDAEIFPDDWSRVGDILFERYDGLRQVDVWALPAPSLRADGTIGPPGKPFPVLTSSFNETHSQLSPDGKWIAYATDESGRPEVFVQSYPPGKGKWPVSLEGGDQPSWRRDGRELYYIDAEKRLVAVEVNTSPTFQIGAATKLFQTTVPTTGLSDARNNYVPRADGRQFLISSMTAAARTNPLRVVVSWTTARTAQ